jgi:hypothetical protein
VASDSVVFLTVHDPSSFFVTLQFAPPTTVSDVRFHARLYPSSLTTVRLPASTDSIVPTCVRCVT